MLVTGWGPFQRIRRPGSTLPVSAGSAGPHEEDSMTKAELVAQIAERTGVSKSDVEKTMKGFEEVVQQVVSKGGDKLSLPGFLSFEQVDRSARTGRNPQTGETIQVPASKAVKISAGATLKKVAKGEVSAPS
jgi:DNA-binding protein HU-beta